MGRTEPASDYFDIVAPAQWTLPVVLNSPHSGSLLPPDLLRQSRLSPNVLRRSEDCYIDELFVSCVQYGAPLLRSRVSRAFIDLNREPHELDPRMFTTPLPGYMNGTSPRVLSGLGTIPRIVGEGDVIYHHKLELVEVMSRIDAIYRPYHRTLGTMLDQVHNETGFVCLIDCHSMPSSAVAGGRNNLRQVDIVLGDRFGASCDPELVQVWREAFTDAGLQIRLNHPYPGGFITETHGRPRMGRNALQIEINRSLYLSGNSTIKSNNFKELQCLLEAAFKVFAGALPAYSNPPENRVAAE
jgi:N-formylglutamate amidohydrolase